MLVEQVKNHLKVKVNVCKNDRLRFHVYGDQGKVAFDCSPTKLHKFMQNSLDHAQRFIINSSPFEFLLAKKKRNKQFHVKSVRF